MGKLFRDKLIDGTFSFSKAFVDGSGHSVTVKTPPQLASVVTK